MQTHELRGFTMKNTQLLEQWGDLSGNLWRGEYPHCAATAMAYVPVCHPHRQAKKKVNMDVITALIIAAGLLSSVFASIILVYLLASTIYDSLLRHLRRDLRCNFGTINPADHDLGK